MNTTDQGDTYENKVFRLVKKLIADGTVAVGKHYSLHQKKAYTPTTRYDAQYTEINEILTIK